MHMGTLNRNLQTTLTVSVIPVLIELFARENMPAHHHDLIAKTRVNDGDLNKIGAVIVVVESKLVKAKKKQAQLQDKAIFFCPSPQKIDHLISIEKSDRCGYQVKFRHKMTAA